MRGEKTFDPPIKIAWGWSVKEPINVLVVDDSFFMRKLVSDMLSSDPNIEIVATAKDGVEAVNKATKLRPDVVIMDVELPKMDGLTALCHIMSENPMPVVMLTAMDKIEADLAVKSFEYGAVDFVSKPSKPISLDIEEVKDELISKIKIAAGANVKKMEFPAVKRVLIEKMFVPPPTKKKVLAIGGSTGGPHALSEILPKLHRNFPLAVLIVQHMPEGFTKPFAERLSWQGSIELKEAEDGDPVKPSLALLAPAGQHMVVKREEKKTIVRLNRGPLVNNMRPSIDVLMKSVAELFGDRAIGVLLSGMGKDGAVGMKAINDRGGRTIVQDEATSVIFGMQKAAMELGCVDSVVSLSEIATKIMEVL